MVDLTKLKKKLEKKEIVTKMNDPDNWLSTGNALLNYRLTGRTDIGIPNRRSCLLWGPSGSGKTFLSSNACLDAQRKGYKIIYLDSEESISEDYMTKIGMDLSEEVFIPVMVSTIEEAIEAISIIFAELSPDSKFMLVIDSLAGLLTEKEANEFESGTSKGDMGQFSKKLKLFTKNINKLISRYDAFCVMVTHAYQNQDLLNGQGPWICTGGKGFQYFPSMSIMLDFGKLKEETGVRIKALVTKTRFTAPFQKCELHVPYDSGIDFYEGMIDFCEEQGLVTKNGAWYSYKKDGEVVKFQSSKLKDHYDDIMKQLDINEELVEGEFEFEVDEEELA